MKKQSSNQPLNLKLQYKYNIFCIDDNEKTTKKETHIFKWLKAASPFINIAHPLPDQPGNLAR